MRLLDRHDQDGGDGGEAGAEAEDQRIDPVDVDAEGGGGDAVPLGRAHDEADAGAGEERPDGGEDEDREADDGELVAGVAEPGELEAEVEGGGDRAGLGAVEAEGALLEDVAEADGGDDHRLGLVVEAAEDEAVEGDGDEGGDERADDEGGEEAEGGGAGEALGRRTRR